MPSGGRSCYRAAMSAARRFLFSALGVALASTQSCGTDAVGVDDCRAIEYARCEAGVSCGLVEDVDTCKRFFRDHCLHGLSIKEAPDDPVVDGCVAAIHRAAECSQSAPALADCPGGGPALAPGVAVTLACDVVRQPESVEACAFLKPVVAPEPPDAMPPDAAADALSDGAPSDASDATVDG